MNELEAKMAFMNDRSSFSFKMGELLRNAPSSDLPNSIAWLQEKLDIAPNRVIDEYLAKLEQLAKLRITLINYFSDDYPMQLRQIQDPPLLLYKRGNLSTFARCIAVAGTRNPSHEGHRTARRVAQFLAENDFTVVSGFARGIDLEAHLGALDVGGRTIAVLPGPINDIQPPEHESLSRDVEKKGALISEVSPMVETSKLSFIRRNRITSGLSNAIILCESDGTGGTLQQFKVALKQGRPVFVIRPKDDQSFSQKGYDQFIREGAIGIDDPLEIIERMRRPMKSQPTLGEYSD